MPDIETTLEEDTRFCATLRPPDIRVRLGNYLERRAIGTDERIRHKAAAGLKKVLPAKPATIKSFSPWIPWIRESSARSKPAPEDYPSCLLSRHGSLRPVPCPVQAASSAQTPKELWQKSPEDASVGTNPQT